MSLSTGVARFLRSTIMSIRQARYQQYLARSESYLRRCIEHGSTDSLPVVSSTLHPMTVQMLTEAQRVCLVYAVAAKVVRLIETDDGKPGLRRSVNPMSLLKNTLARTLFMHSDLLSSPDPWFGQQSTSLTHRHVPCDRALTRGSPRLSLMRRFPTLAANRGRQSRSSWKRNRYPRCVNRFSPHSLGDIL